MSDDEINELIAMVSNEPSDAELRSFARTIAAKEREACAKVCETTVWSKDVKWWMQMTKTQVSAEAGHQCAAAIRARGE